MNLHFLKNRPFIIGFAVILIIGVLGIGTYHYISRTPEFSLKSAGTAVKEKDWDKFSKYVDIRSILDKGADNIIEEYITQQKLDANQSSFTRNTVRFLKPQIIGFVEAQIKLYLFSDEDMTASASEPSKKISDSAKKSSSSKLKLTQMDSKYIGNDFAIATLHFQSENDPNSKRVLKIKMIDQDDHWQAIEITNLSEVLKWPEAMDILGK